MKIKPFVKGSKTRTALHADAINELVAERNKWGAVKFSPEGIAKLDESDANVVLSLNRRQLFSGANPRQMRICIGGTAQQVLFGSVAGPPGTTWAHLPFLSEDISALTPGSFMGGGTEDAFMASIWRLRRWNLYGHLERVPHGDSPVVEFDDPTGPGYILNGESNFAGLESDAFIDLDDILTQWRATRSYSAPEIGAAGIDMFWGPRGSYSLEDGRLDSEILITATEGDTEFFLGTQQGREVGGPDGGVLDTASSVALHFTDCDGTTTLITLWYPNNVEVPTIDDWTGDLYLKPGDLWWPWPIDGTDTWNIGTGAQEEDPLRLDTNGSPRAFLAQQA